MTPHRRPRTLHGTANDDARAPARQATAEPPDTGPVRAVTQGEAEDPSTGPGSPRPDERKHRKTTPRANRVFVVGSDGKPVLPCTPRRVRQLIDAKRVRKRTYRPYGLHVEPGACRPTTSQHRPRLDPVHTPASHCGQPPADGPFPPCRAPRKRTLEDSESRG